MNPTRSTRDITLELLAIQEHINKKPKFELGNSLRGWVARGGRTVTCTSSPELCVSYRILNEIVQCNILYWETASPRWELPDYVNAMALDVQEAKDWISRSVIRTGGSTQGPAQKAASDGESEVDQSEATAKMCHPRQVFLDRRFMPRTSKMLSWTRVHGLQHLGSAKAGGFSLE